MSEVDLLIALDIAAEADVFVARQAGRDLAAVLGCHQQDQIRIATALSEVGREMLAAAGGTIEFRLLSDPPGRRLEITAAITGRPDHDWGRSDLAAVGRLLDEVRVVPAAAGSVAVRMLKRLPSRGGPAEGQGMDELRDKLAEHAPTSAMEELRRQNQDLLSTLEQLQSQQEELVQLNAELEDTNKGVMALYNQLSAELEETNRGVVALYAELDEKGMQLERANDAKTRFLQAVSHELRTPVNSVLGLARLLLDPQADPLTEEQRRQVSLVHSSGTDLLGLVNDLLDLAKAESGRFEVTSTEVDPSALAEALRETIAPLVRPGVGLRLEAAGAVPVVRTDEGLLRHVLRNLLSNAAKFTEQGEIVVRLGTDGDDLLVEVRDTGIGISAEDQPRVFEEFYQARNQLQARNKGTGLGLPLAQRLAGQLGGRIELVSTPGAGSSFTLRLPRGGPTTGEDAAGGAPWTG